MRFGTCPECGAALRPGNALFTRECQAPDCGAVWSVDVGSDLLTFDECMALVGVDEMKIREEIGGKKGD